MCVCVKTELKQQAVRVVFKCGRTRLHAYQEHPLCWSNTVWMLRVRVCAFSKNLT